MEFFFSFPFHFCICLCHCLWFFWKRSGWIDKDPVSTLTAISQKLWRFSWVLGLNKPSRAWALTAQSSKLNHWIRKQDYALSISTWYGMDSNGSNKRGHVERKKPNKITIISDTMRKQFMLAAKHGAMRNFHFQSIIARDFGKMWFNIFFTPVPFKHHEYAKRIIFK